jgi:hypothetical protein
MSATRLRPFALVAAMTILLSCNEESSFEPPAQTGAPQLVGAPAGDVIPGQYIVVFRDGVRSPATAAKEMAVAHGLKLRHTYSHTIRGFSAVVPEGRLAALQRHPLVKYVQPNRYLYIDTHERFNRARSSPVGTSAEVAAPTGLSVVAISSSEILLSWDDNSDNESGFEIQGSKGLDGPLSKIASVKANVTQYTDKELSADILYCYRVRATVGKGRNKQFSAYTPTKCARTPTGEPGEPPADNRPTDLAADEETELDALILTWIDNWDSETHYAIERCGPVMPDPDPGPEPEPGCSDFRGLVRVGANVTSYTDAAVTAYFEYCYRVKGMREKGKKVTYTEYSNVACAVPLPGSVPDIGTTALSATAISHRAIDLEWTDGATGENGFRIFRSVDGAPFEEVHTTGLGVTSYLDDALQSGKRYYYEVYAKNVHGNSANAATDDATTSEFAAPCPDSGEHDDIDTQLWNIRRVRAHRNLKWQATTSCPLTAELYVLDTGVDLASEELNVLGSECFLDGCTQADDANGHGTHVAGTAAGKDRNGGIVGVAPGAPVYAYKVCDDEGVCTSADVIEAIELVTARKGENGSRAMVVNLSLGGPGTDEALETAVRTSVEAGVVFAISAGNGELGACLIPANAQFVTPARVGDDEITADGGSDGDAARTNGAIVVTASNLSDGHNSCNYGNPVTVAAPGVDILSAAPGGGTATMAGSSMATPHVAGAAILFLQDHIGATPYDVEQAILMWLNTDPWASYEFDTADGRLDVEKL